MRLKINLKGQLVKAILDDNEISVVVPNRVKEIGPKAFCKDDNLELIDLPKNLLKINERAFFACENLTTIYLKDPLEYIGNNAFQMCEKLNDIMLPSNLKYIGEAAFAECSSLKSVRLPLGIENLNDYAFYKCVNLEEVVIPESISNINKSVFEGCTNLKKITIPASALKIENSAFKDCDNIEEVTLGRWSLLIEEDYGLEHVLSKLPFCYANKENGELLLTKEIKEDLVGFEKVDYVEKMERFNCSRHVAIVLSLTFSEDKLREIDSLKKIIPSVVVENIDKDNCVEFREKMKYLKEFSALIKRLDKFMDIEESGTKYYVIFKLAFSLGAFNENKSIRQRACEFIYDICESQLIDFSTVNKVFGDLNLKMEFNEEWVSFVTDKKKFKQLIQLENKYPQFISKIYNNFDEIKEFSRSSKGSLRYRKVTVEMCEKYMFEMNFNGVDESNQDIADILKLYAHEQGTFDKACEIREKYLNLKKNKKIKDHILGEELFSTLKDIEKEILDGVSSTMKNLNDLANERFTYEYLSKDDVVNFVVGIYCNCCAHLEGVGKGIVEAAILHPDCQCLVIRNNKGEIIGKSSLYVNRKQGYAIFNNVEINENSLKEDDKNLIYIKYMEAVDSFAKKYNKKHPFNPIRQINVGLSSNKLAYQMRGLENAKKILSAEGFSRFSSYEGDWRYNQKIIWKIDDNFKR